jgi:hypothetical protein
MLWERGTTSACRMAFGSRLDGLIPWSPKGQAANEKGLRQVLKLVWVPQRLLY